MLVLAEGDLTVKEATGSGQQIICSQRVKIDSCGPVPVTAEGALNICHCSILVCCGADMQAKCKPVYQHAVLLRLLGLSGLLFYSTNCSRSMLLHFAVYVGIRVLLSLSWPYSYTAVVDIRWLSLAQL